MKPYEWMVEYTPQTEWIDRRGILVWLAEVSGAFGGGLYLVSLYFNSLWGMFVGLLIMVAKGGFHFAHLGQPLRFWRLVLRPGTSWLARGFIFLTLFIVFGAVQLAFSHWLPGTASEDVFKALTGIMAVLVAAYPGFVMNYVTGVPLWNSALLPLLFISFGGLGGLAVIIVIGLFTGNVDLIAVVAGIRLLLIFNAFLITIYLWSATYMGPTGKQSVRQLIQGHTAPILWVGVAFCGIVLPLSISIYTSFVGGVSVPLLITAAACVIIGVFSLNYCILRSALYSPLVPT